MGMIPTREEAQACADRCAERRKMCAGCYGDFYCGIEEKLAKTNPVGAELMRDVIQLIATDGREGRR